MLRRAMRTGLCGLVATALLAQSQPTFYAAWEDGQEAERHGQWRAALAAYERAAALRPTPAGRVIIYGNNLVQSYFPYTRMARCHAELGEWDAAEALLGKAAALGEPAREREALSQRIRQGRPPRESQPSPHPEASQPRTVPRPAPSAQSEIQPPKFQEPAPPPQARPPEAEPAAPASLPLPKPAIAAKAPETTPSVSSSLPPAPLPQGHRRSLLWMLGALGGAALLAIGFGLRRRRRVRARAAFAEPEQLGPYRVERLLGRGGFASTYLARHEGTGRRVALKLLHPYRQGDPEFLARFRQEARLGALLDHPNLVRLVEASPEDDLPWIAMEYVDGTRLDALLKTRGALSPVEALPIALGIASAMAHAHLHGVVHRDLKPANVILAAGQARVMDFGISRIVDAETLTTTYAFLGTPLYAAPEAQLKTQVGPAADRYSLGIILFEMLAGRPPFQGETPFEILDRHRFEPLPDLRAIRPDAPTELVGLVERLAAKAPEQRPGDEEMLHILGSLAGGALSKA